MHVAIALLLTVLPVAAQNRTATFTVAEQDFQQLELDLRIKLQVMLTAAGHWHAVPNENFSTRLFKAISEFQVAHGFKADGRLRGPALERLVELSTPRLASWNFRAVPHPARRRSIWVPMGLGLIPERTPEGLAFRDPQDRFFQRFSYHPNVEIRHAAETLVQQLLNEGSTINYKVLRERFFVVASSKGGLDSYIRFHQDGLGILGFQLLWRPANGNLYVERAAALISASLLAAMTGASFTEPPIFESGPTVSNSPVAVKPTTTVAAPEGQTYAPDNQAPDEKAPAPAIVAPEGQTPAADRSQTEGEFRHSTFSGSNTFASAQLGNVSEENYAYRGNPSSRAAPGRWSRPAPASLFDPGLDVLSALGLQFAGGLGASLITVVMVLVTLVFTRRPSKLLGVFIVGTGISLGLPFAGDSGTAQLTAQHVLIFTAGTALLGGAIMGLRMVAKTVTLRAPRSAMKKSCQRCAEKVRAAAQVCRYCGHEFSTQGP